MDAVTNPPAQIIHIDDQDDKHLEDLAQNVTLATNDKTGIPSLKPMIDQEVLSKETQQEAEDFVDQDKETKQESALSNLIPALQKKVRTTRASNFLQEKMEWLGKKNGS